jgi:AcrR family transcriptional regulator
MTDLPSAVDRRAEIVDAAATVLRRVGFERMRLRDVAEEAGVSIGLLQHYFETSEQLGREAFAAACGTRATKVADMAIEEGSAWGRIERILRNAFERKGLNDRAATWLDLCSSASRDQGLRKEAVKVQDVWREPLLSAITQGQETRELRPTVSPIVAVEVLLAIIDGTELATTIRDRRIPLDDLLAATLEITRRMLGVGASR